MKTYTAEIKHGDCLDVLPDYPDNTFDLIVTSPPYADKRKHTYGGVPPEKYVEWFLPRSKQFLRVLKPNGTFILNIKEKAENGERHTFVDKLSDLIDLEFERDSILYVVSIKSGPNWGNSSQINKMKENFRKAKRVLGTHSSSRNIVAVNGCCYGREASQDKVEYLKLCGQNFWTFISGIETLYKDIIEPIGHKAKERNEEFTVEYGKVINRFTREFIEDFCREDGAILWHKVVEFSSSSQKSLIEVLYA